MEKQTETIVVNKKSSFSFRFVILFLIVISIIGFCIQNNSEIQITAMFWDVEVSLIMLLFIFFITGLLVSFFLLGPLFSNSAKKNKQILELNQKITDLELKLKNEKI